MTSSGHEGVMRRIIYVSTAEGEIEDDQLFDILTVARDRNARLGVTGILIFGGDVFTQILEGPEDALEEVYRSICADPRHRDIRTVEDVKDIEPHFNDWTMAFVREETFVQSDRLSLQQMRDWISANAGEITGDPGILEFATRAFLDAIRRLQARQNGPSYSY